MTIVPYLLLSFYIVITSTIIRGCKTLKGNSLYIKYALFMFVLLLVFVVASFYGYRVIDNNHGGIDTLAYERTFNSLNTNDYISIFGERIEKGFLTAMWLVKYLGLSFNFFMLLFFVFLSAFYYRICNVITLNMFTIFSFTLFSILFVESFNISRMSLGGIICFCGLIEFANKRYCLALFYIILASTVQMVFIWGFLLFLYSFLLFKLPNRKSRFVINLSMFLFCFVAVELFKSVLIIVGYAYYLKDGEVSFSPYSYIYLTLLLLVYHLFLSDYVRNVYTKFFFTLLPTMYFVLPLYMAIPIAYRFNYIYLIMFAFVIPDILYASKKTKNGSSIMVFVCLLPTLYTVGKVFGYFGGDIQYVLDWKLSPNLLFYNYIW
jgi:hypothetical protein